MPPDAAQAAIDRRSGLLAASVWGATALKMAPLMPASANIQSVAGLASILAVSTLWPTLRPRSYARWRTPALAALRLALIALPFNYQAAVFDAIVPGPATGRWAWAANASNLLMGTHIALLLFSALLWRLPLGPHLAVQTTAVGLLVGSGVHPHCQSQLLSSAPVQALAAAFVGGGSVATAVMLPAAPAAHLHLEDPFRQTVAALLFLWLLLGWLLPTLLILPTKGWPAEHEPAQGASVLAATAARLDHWLRSLLPEPLGAAGAENGGGLPGTLLMRWFIVLVAVFEASCAVAQLYSAPRP